VAGGRRGNHEGTIQKRADDQWQAIVSMEGGGASISRGGHGTRWPNA
jgi:hypothetical protein